MRGFDSANTENDGHIFVTLGAGMASLAGILGTTYNGLVGAHYFANAPKGKKLKSAKGRLIATTILGVATSVAIFVTVEKGLQVKISWKDAQKIARQIPAKRRALEAQIELFNVFKQHHFGENSEVIEIELEELSPEAIDRFDS